MYCVIQEITKKNPNKHGYSKELQVSSYSFTINGVNGKVYTYHYSDEKFQRDIRKAYKISIHESYRKDGKVKKRQFNLCTVDYYDIAEELFCLYDYADTKIQVVADELNMDMETIYELVDSKMQPLIEKIQEEFVQTEEFKTHAEHERITTLYAASKAEFNEKYELDGNEYDKCYDVFGTLRNPEYLEQIKKGLQISERI